MRVAVRLSRGDDRHRQSEALHARGEVEVQPVGHARRQRGDDDLVVVAVLERRGDRRERIGVADQTFDAAPGRLVEQRIASSSFIADSSVSASQNARGTSSVKLHGTSEARLRTSSISAGSRPCDSPRSGCGGGADDSIEWLRLARRGSELSHSPQEYYPRGTPKEGRWSSSPDSLASPSGIDPRPAAQGRSAWLLRDEPARYRIEWDDGHESIYTPAAGALYAEPVRGAAG